MDWRFSPIRALNVVLPYLPPLTEQHFLDVRNLKQSSQQAEDALSQGIDNCKKVLAERIAFDITAVASTNHEARMAATMENLQAVEGYVNQADNLRQHILQQMSKVLTTRESAWGLLALGEYFHRLRALSSP
ncbi:hypothetical protein N665_0089s0022 [Sinapis alba]|nr:hypothetical protein N665_0089s0022 [Sinapis alba]